jgi:hypothetical protein
VSECCDQTAHAYESERDEFGIEAAGGGDIQPNQFVRVMIHSSYSHSLSAAESRCDSCFCLACLVVGLLSVKRKIEREREREGSSRMQGMFANCELFVCLNEV